jgi:hypothetical protein
MKPDAVWRGADLPVDDTDVALFSAATRVTVHSGKTAKFWTSSWIDGMSLPSMFPRLFEHCKKENRTVAEAMHNSTWISDLMHDVTTPIFGDYVMLWIMVEAAGFNPLDAADDQIIWTRAADGCYSAKSAYLLQFEGCVESFQKQVWKVWASSRYKFFMWLLLQKRIWTADRLLAREWINQYLCPLCCRSLEMADHLFLECPFS